MNGKLITQTVGREFILEIVMYVSPSYQLLQTKGTSDMMDCFYNLLQSFNVALGTTRTVECPLYALESQW